MKQENLNWHFIDLGNEDSFPKSYQLVVFFVRGSKKPRIGHYQNGKFDVFEGTVSEDKSSFTQTVNKQYDPVFVDGYVLCKDIHNLFVPLIDLNLIKTTDRDTWVIAKNVIGCSDDFYTVHNLKDESVDNDLTYFTFAELPEFFDTHDIVDDDYTMTFCDDNDGWFTYNVYKKTFFNLFDVPVFASESQCRADAYKTTKDFFDSLVSQNEIQ